MTSKNYRLSYNIIAYFCCCKVTSQASDVFFRRSSASGALFALLSIKHHLISEGQCPRLTSDTCTNSAAMDMMEVENDT